MIVINLIDKDRVQGHEDFGDARAVWRARLFLFIGFALMAGGLAGSVVSTSSILQPWRTDSISPFNSLCGFGIHGGPAEVLCRPPKRTRGL